MNRRYPDWTRPLVLVVCGALLALVACFGDGPPTPYERCLLADGQWIARPQPDTRSGIVNYCSFPDGTECAEAQLWDRTCAVPGAAINLLAAPDAPVGPLPTPIAPASPAAVPSGGGVAMGGAGVMAYPRSFEELVDSAVLIVLGKVGPAVQYLDLGGYGGSDGKQPMGTPTDPTSMMLFGWSVTDLLIEVEQVIRDDGSIAAGKPIILRILGFATAKSKKLTEGGEFPLSYTGDQHLFLLGANPDDTYGLTFGPRSRLIVDGDILRVSDGTQQPLLFVDSTGPISLDDLITYVETGTLPVKENTLGLLAVPDVPIEPEATPFVDAAARRSDYLVVRPPQSLAALIKHAPLIFIGKVGPVHEYLDFYSYGEDGELILNALPEGRGPTPAYPATEFLLEVETVIRDDGTIAAGEPIILQVVGHITEESKRLTQADAYPVSYTGDRHLFMLTPNVGGRNWVLEYGPWSRLIVDGDILRVSDGERSPLQFGESSKPITLEEFTQFVENW